jgi:GxxExxY protein
LIVENTVVVEVKSVDRLIPVFTPQLVSYLRVTDCEWG